MPTRACRLTLVSILAAGLFLVVLNADLPILRNSFNYAKSVSYINERGALPVLLLERLNFGKPVGFSFLCLPFINLMGTRVGMRVVSFLGMAFFVLVAWRFFVRANTRLGLDARLVPLELVLMFFNPLLLYQFWSAYPDGLFAAQTMLAFLLTDRIARETERDARGAIVLLGVVIYSAILVKLYGLILGFACPVYLLFHWRSLLPTSAVARRRLAWLTLVFGILGTAVVLGKQGMNPTIAIGSGGSEHFSVGISEMSAGVTDLSVSRILAVLGGWVFALLLNFHFALLFLLKASDRPRWPFSWTCFVGIFLLGLVPFGEDVAYNMRYIIPVFPFLVVAIVYKMSSISTPLVRRATLWAYLAAASFWSLNYNVPVVHEMMLDMNQELRHSAINSKLDRKRLDNLRIDEHIYYGALFDRINEVIEPGGHLYWYSNYSGTTTHRVIEDMIRPDIDVFYPRQPGDVPSIVTDRPFYYARYEGESWSYALERRFHVTPVGSGLKRYSLPFVLVAPEPNQIFTAGEPVRLAARSRVPLLRVEFLLDGRTVAVARTPPYEAIWHAKPGRHQLSALGVRQIGTALVPGPHTVFVDLVALERPLSHPDDDAEERADGSMYLDSSDLEMVLDEDPAPQLIGLRFSRLALPAGATIGEAHIQFSSYGDDDEPTELTIQAERAASAGRLEKTIGYLSSRPRTGAAVHWRPEPWSHNTPVRTPDLAAILQELVAAPTWQPGNSILFLISGTGKRVARAVEGAQLEQDRTRLYVEWSTDDPKPR